MRLERVDDRTPDPALLSHDEAIALELEAGTYDRASADPQGASRGRVGGEVEAVPKTGSSDHVREQTFLCCGLACPLYILRHVASFVGALSLWWEKLLRGPE
jgi:hypothetical protein